MPLRALAHRGRVRARHGLRPQAHAGGACCPWCWCSWGRRGAGHGRIVAFAAAAAAPFLPYLFSSPRGLWYVFQYHLERPLQIESVLGTPMLFGQLLGAHWADLGLQPRVALSGGARRRPGGHLSGGLMLLAVVVVYLLVWRRRERLRASLPDQALAVLALILALMAFGKVLSPQYFIWTLPAWALVAARDRVLAVIGGVMLLLTQIEFPARYWNLADMQPATLTIVITRNTLTVAVFCIAAWRLWGLPDDGQPMLQRPGRSRALAARSNH